jgi:CPA1 family monovalent cation:H+ antiporter
MHYAVIFVLLLVFVFGLGLLARRLAIPYPIFFVVGGLLISFVPHLPRLQLDPDFIFFIFLPPLLYIQAFNTSWRDFRSELRAILLLAIGLVLATTVAIAYLAHALIPGLPLAAGFVLGAIISPPDAIAATAIAQQLGLPRQVVTILEGESLVNDSTSLVAYKIALGAIAMTGHPLVGDIWLPGTFVYVSVGGIAVGLCVGWVAEKTRLWVVNDGANVVLTVSLLVPFLSYLAAEPLQVSSVLAVVTTGLYMGWGSPEVIPSGIRLQARAVWNMIIYLLNGFIFVLIGLQLPVILHGLAGYSWAQLLFYAFVINAACILVRIAWIFPGAYAPYIFKFVRRRERPPDWREVFIVSWSGMRGIVSLAAALALEGQVNFPQAHVVQFLAFSVILVTLVFQGLTLPPIIRYLGVGDDGSATREEQEARQRMSDVVLKKIEEARSEAAYPSSAIEAVEQTYRERALALHDDLADQLGWSEHRLHVVSSRRLRRAMISLQRHTLVEMRRTGLIGDDVMHKIEHELDLEEARLKS